MSEISKSNASRPENAAPDKDLSPVAIRALEEAQARRIKAKADAEGEKPTEYNGPKGEEPTRFGDWERKGITYDF